MAELWPLQVGGEGGGVRSEIFAFCGLCFFFFLRKGFFAMLLKGHPLFQLSFSSREGREKEPPVSYLLKKVWRCSLFK